eukprot:14096222-Heterocapsa_arctica.AAC.1
MQAFAKEKERQIAQAKGHQDKLQGELDSIKRQRVKSAIQKNKKQKLAARSVPLGIDGGCSRSSWEHSQKAARQ